MLDIRLIREDREKVRAGLAKRHGGDESAVERIVDLDERRRERLVEVEELKSRRNTDSKAIGGLMKDGRREKAEAMKEQVRETNARIGVLEEEVGKIEEELRGIMLRVPNIPHESVPEGRTEADNPEIRRHGSPKEFSFKARNHIEICEALGLIDFKRAAKLSGSGFLLYTGMGARLERGLISFLLDLHQREHGYTEVSPPFLVNRDCMEGVGQFPKFEDQVYVTQEGVDGSTLGQLCLVPTAEAPVANLHREELLSVDDLPRKYCAYTPCFRAEAGAAGVGTRGMIRVHQFDKVELINVVHPDEGYDRLEEMVGCAEKILKLLGLHFRTIVLCTGDMGFGSAKTYDIEVWAPGQNQYLEVSSCSNCEDFQARRMNLRFKDKDGKNRYPHILNGSGTALARLYVALLETHQQEDGSVIIPEILRPYMGGAERLEAGSRPL
jgi:seryl-tRNA synthetase